MSQVDTLFYLLIGAGFLGGLYWILTQITRRQRKVDESLRRLEELVAEVTMEAGAVLEEAEDRIELLRELLHAVELKAVEEGAEQAAPAPGQVWSEAAQAEAPDTKAAPLAAPTAAAVRTAQAAPDSPAAPAAPAAAAPALRQQAAPVEAAAGAALEPRAVSSLERYQRIRATVWALDDQGLSPAEISQQLGVPRGEVLLMLNLKARRVTA